MDLSNDAEFRNYMMEQKDKINNIFETLRMELEKLGFYVLETDTNCKGKDYEYTSWADFRTVKDGKETNISWSEPIDYSHIIKYSRGKDKWETGFYTVEDIPRLIQQIKDRMNMNESLNEVYFPELEDKEMDALYAYFEAKIRPYGFWFKDGMVPKATRATYEYKDFIHDGEELASLIRYYKDRTLIYVEDIDTIEWEYAQIDNYTDKFENVDSEEKIEETISKLFGELDESVITKLNKVINEALGD